MQKKESDLRDDFRKDLTSSSLEFVSSKWILERIPYVFNGDYSSFLNVKMQIAQAIKVDSCSIFFVGSSSVGFSLNPQKNLKLFDDKSDIDIAIVSHYYFDVAWRAIQDIDVSLVPYNIQLAIKDHRERLIYWETVALDKVLGIMPFGAEWLKVLEDLKQIVVFHDRRVSFRLYRNTEALRRYQINNFKRSIDNFLGVEPQSINL